jgi:hypothetical protein
MASRPGRCTHTLQRLRSALRKTDAEDGRQQGVVAGVESQTEEQYRFEVADASLIRIVPRYHFLFLHLFSTPTFCKKRSGPGDLPGLHVFGLNLVQFGIWGLVGRGSGWAVWVRRVGNGGRFSSFSQEMPLFVFS